ncbi:MAG: signal peptidase II [Prevotellaceae bacterium]|jgi:signal peptidase II|nr:signal peptidase II [Prevotellaceae bacterium]
MALSVGKKSILVILLVLIIDQISKIWIKTHFALGESVEVFSWFQIAFIENNGMAFGMEFIGKLFLTLFRIVAVGGIGYLIYRFIKQNKYSDGFIICIALIFAGALGNIIDCVFYGVAFDYAPLFYGKVVDMLYFPIIRNAAGETLFFSPVFNIADSAITVAVIYILIFYRKYLGDNKNEE